MIGGASYQLAAHKGRSPWGWTALSLLCGVLALAVLAGPPNVREQDALAEKRHQELLAVLRSRSDP
jgi:hypothetical protein